MLYDAPLSQKFAAKMAEEGSFVTGFYYPVVPKGQARIRVQLSAAHEKQHLDKAIAAFVKVGRELGSSGSLSLSLYLRPISPGIWAAFFHFSN